MMAAYLTAYLEVTDPEAYRAYSIQIPALIQRYNGRFLARGGGLEVLEGGLPSKRAVIIEFPTVDLARKFYFSPEYQQIVPVRQKNSRTDLIAIVEGVAAL
jgi:uncharacterized protein (DUF1330 family)